jgi:branched-chain amino acid aminotransferase
MSIIPFDDRDGSIWYDGKLVPWREAKLHVLTHGLHYASAVFEGIRVYNGKAFKLTEHNERLIKSGKILGFEVPYKLEELNKATEELIKVQKVKNGYVRPIAWRGSEMIAVSAQACKIHVAIATWEWPSYFSPEAREKGLRLCWADWKRPDPATAPTASKAVGLYMICTLSKHSAEDKGYNDAMMLDWRGYLAEATGANVFFVIDGKLHTPIPDCFLDGITRRTVITLAKKRGIEVIERHIKPDELENATEAFLTGTAAEITRISEIEDYKFAESKIIKLLQQDFDKVTLE